MPRLIQGQYIQVHKLNPNHQETWHYWAQVKNILSDGILLEAFFDAEDRPFHGIKLEKNDRFIERYYTNRWYNIYEIYQREKTN